jgi:hypothetical protein
MDTVIDLKRSTAMAATGQARAAAAVQVKLSSHGYYIDHPDSEGANSSWRTPWGSLIAMR